MSRTYILEDLKLETNNTFRFVLVALGIGFCIAGLLHVVFGLGADQMLGANVSAQSLTDAGLDSQNRFYGAAFTLYGVLLITISNNIEKYSTILRCVMGVFLFAGAVRFISVILYGWPPLMMGVLFALELLVPLLVLLGLSSFQRRFTSRT